MTDEDLAFKAHASMQPVIGDAARHLIDMAYSIEAYEVRDLMRLATPGVAQ